MNSNKTILNIIKSKRMILIIFVIFQIAVIFLLNKLFYMFLLKSDFPKYFQPIFYLFYFIGFICMDILQIIVINKLKSLRNTIPIKCIIEDCIVTSKHHSRKRVYYRLNLVVKSIEDNKLYFLFNKYDLHGYNFKYTSSGVSPNSIQIYRKDGTIVEIGDIAYLYMRRNIAFDVKIDSEKNKVKLGNKKYVFIHVNEKYDINMFDNLNYIEGVIDIERDNI